MSEFITKATVLAIHAHTIETYGGSAGLRDEGLLEAAVFRPQTGYYRDVIEEAAALWESLSQNHPFIDGNKRAAFGSLNAFLFANGVLLQASLDEAIDFVVGLYKTDSFRFDQLVSWLREKTPRK